MPPELSNEQEIQFRKRARRRLVGAIALVLLMVTILPMVLDDRSNKTPPQEIAITIPSQNGSEFTSKIVPVEPEPAKAPVAGPTAPVAEAPPATETSVPEKPVAGISTKPEKSETVATQAATEKSGFSVQIGVFSDPANLKLLQDKLSAQGHKSYTEKISSANGDKFRLRAGPFASKEEAESALASIKSAGLPGMVVGNK